jgi:hypothetical protein
VCDEAGLAQAYRDKDISPTYRDRDISPAESTVKWVTNFHGSSSQTTQADPRKQASWANDPGKRPGTRRGFRLPNEPLVGGRAGSSPLYKLLYFVSFSKIQKMHF